MKQTAKLTLIAIGLVMTLRLANAEPASTPQMSKAEAQRLVRQAHTPEEYRTLAEYFRAQQREFEQKARSEKQEWERRSQNVTGPAAKYPRPVDSSKNRYEYFNYQAAHMSQQAEHFEALAKP